MEQKFQEFLSKLKIMHWNEKLISIYLSIIVFFALYIAQHIGILKRIKFLAKEEETPKGELGSSFQRQSWGFGRDG